MGLNIGPPSQQDQNEAAWYYQQEAAKKRKAQRKKDGHNDDYDAFMGLVLIFSLFIGYHVLRYLYLAVTSWVADLFWWWPF